jgi:hypothetical protein
MAKPASRQELIDYCLRRLGAPVLEINVDDDQIDDLVDDALQYFQERHFDGVERMFLKYKITQDDINRGKAAVPSGPLPQHLRWELVLTGTKVQTIFKYQTP